ncbi:LLM class flavin-dependent oxidoreductase [Nonomuraea antimicrobica]
MPGADEIAALKRRMGRVGVWNSTLGGESAVFEQEAAAEVESLGFGTLWVGETPSGKEALTHAALLLGGTRRLTVATGIANIWARDATAAANGANTLAESSGGRFVLGLGVSHAPLVSQRGHDYRKPVSAMREYLDAMDATDYTGPLPEPAPRLLAALRPKMLELAARRPTARTRTSCRRSTRPAPARCSARCRCWRRSRPCWSRPTPNGRGGPPAASWRSTWPCRTTSTTCAISAGRRRTWPVAGVTRSSTPSWRGGAGDDHRAGTRAPRRGRGPRVRPAARRQPARHAGAPAHPGGRRPDLPLTSTTAERPPPPGVRAPSWG